MSVGVATAGSGTTRAALVDRADDFYATPIEALRPLIALEGARMPRVLWEPCCGDGALVVPLRESGRIVVATDLVERGCPDATPRVDALMERQVPPGCFGIVTNPPFKLADEFATHLMGLSPYVALLLRLGWLEGVARLREVFRVRPPARFWVSSRRLPMMHRGGWEGPKSTSTVCFMWVVWDGDDGGRRVDWFDWQDFEPGAGG